MADAGQMPTGQWFAAAFDTLLPDLYGAAMRLCRNPADAQDLVADSVAAAWIKRDTLADRATVRGWLFTILTNRFRDCRRRQIARGIEEPLDQTPEGGESFSLFEKLHRPILLFWDNSERAFLDKLLREDFERAIDALPDSLRVVVVLAHLEGFKYHEIAAQLDIPIGTVRSRLGRARARLQQSLWNHAVDAGLAGSDQPQRTKP
jgi:RNA polymerase sigma-70 factor (ECF subfamily)